MPSSLRFTFSSPEQDFEDARICTERGQSLLRRVLSSQVKSSCFGRRLREMGLWSTRLNPTQPDSTRPDRTGSSRSPDQTTPDYQTGRRNKVDRAWTPVFGVCACRQRLILTRPNGQIDLPGQVSQAGPAASFLPPNQWGRKKKKHQQRLNTGCTYEAFPEAHPAVSSLCQGNYSCVAHLPH